MSDIIEAAARALYPYSGPPATETRLLEVHAAAKAVLAAVEPLISANALEAAAKVVETKQFFHYSEVTPYIAVAIRALKEPVEHEPYIWRKRRVYGEDDGPWPPPGDYHSSANEASIEQIKSALEEVSKGIDLIDCSGPAANQNIAAITKLILPELKRALAALARMEQP